MTRVAAAATWLIRGAALVLVAAAAWRLGPCLYHQLRAPFDLLYETPTLRTVQILQAGGNPYDPRWYLDPPFWLQLYTPLYPALTALLPAPADNPFLPGRALSAAALLAAACLVFVVRGRIPAIAALALGAFFLVRPVSAALAYMKSDALAAALSAVPVALVASRPSGWRLYAAAGGAVAAFAAKQSALAGGLAAGAYLLLRDRRAFLRYTGCGLIAGGVALGAAHAGFGPGFWFSIVRAPANPVDLSNLARQWLAMLEQPVFVLLLAAGLLALVLGARSRGRAFFTASPWPLYALTNLVLVTAIGGKLGSESSYFIEPALALALLGVSAAPQWATSRRGRIALAGGALAVAAAACVEIAVAPRASYARTDAMASAAREKGNAVAARFLRAHGDARPVVLNLYHASLSHPLPAEVWVHDPLLYLILWSQGSLPQEPVVDALRRQEPDYVVLPRVLPPALGQPYLKPLRQALEQAYRPAHHGALMQIWVPRAGGGSGEGR